MKAPVFFSNLGHLLMHMMAAYYFVVVLAIEQDWATPYATLIELWALGALLVGLMALPAGWLADRWSAAGMLVVFFVGMGGAAAACGVARSPRDLWLALTALGAFAGIYHPVGTAWLVRHATAPGRALGMNGAFGSLGVAGAGLVAGALADTFGWRIAFLVPGAASIAAGLALLWWWRRAGHVDPPPAGEAPVDPAPSSREARVRAFLILVWTMFLGAVIYQATQASLPKLFALRAAGLVGSGTFGVGALVATVYLAAGMTQLAAGTLADRYPLKSVYVLAFVLQVPLLWAVAGLRGAPLVALAALAVIANVGSLPAENVLLAAATPGRRHGLAFGIKFVLSFGAAPLAIQLVAVVTERAGHPGAVFPVLAALAAATALVAGLLPGQAPRPLAAGPPLEPERLRLR